MTTPIETDIAGKRRAARGAGEPPADRAPEIAVLVATKPTPTTSRPGRQPAHRADLGPAGQAGRGGRGLHRPARGAAGAGLNRHDPQRQGHPAEQARPRDPRAPPPVGPALPGRGRTRGSQRELGRREAGATWGTVQHQFGDVDGLWAAVLEYVLSDRSAMTPGSRTPPTSAPGRRDPRPAVDGDGPARRRRAIHHLRLALPQGREELEAAYPRTAAAIAHWDEAWTATVAHAFDGLDVDPVRLSRVRSLLPGAMRGLHSEQHLSTLHRSRRGAGGPRRRDHRLPVLKGVR